MKLNVSISSPPTKSPCFFGIDTPDRRELIAADHDTEAIRRHVGADSLAYLSLEGLFASLESDGDERCAACWTENYPVPLPRDEAAQLRLFAKSRR